MFEGREQVIKAFLRFIIIIIIIIIIIVISINVIIIIHTLHLSFF